MGKDSHEKNRRKRPRVRRFFMFHGWVIDSPAYAELRPPAKAALVALARLYRGSNNGRLALSARDLAARLKTSKDTAARSLRELEAAGLITVMKTGTFRRKDRMASEYRLTFEPCDVTGDPAVTALPKKPKPV